MANVRRLTRTLGSLHQETMFDTFWKAYPKKAAKPAAQRAFKTAKIPSLPRCGAAFRSRQVRHVARLTIVLLVVGRRIGERQKKQFLGII